MLARPYVSVSKLILRVYLFYIKKQRIPGVLLSPFSFAHNIPDIVNQSLEDSIKKIELAGATIDNSWDEYRTDYPKTSIGPEIKAAVTKSIKDFGEEYYTQRTVYLETVQVYPLYNIWMAIINEKYRDETFGMEFYKRHLHSVISIPVGIMIRSTCTVGSAFNGKSVKRCFQERDSIGVIFSFQEKGRCYRGSAVAIASEIDKSDIAPSGYTLSFLHNNPPYQINDWGTSTIELQEKNEINCKDINQDVL